MALYSIITLVYHKSGSTQVVGSVCSHKCYFSHIEVDIVDPYFNLGIIGNILNGTESAAYSMRHRPVVRISKDRTVVISHIHLKVSIIFTA